jgi:hypothetical protein
MNYSNIIMNIILNSIDIIMNIISYLNPDLTSLSLSIHNILTPIHRPRRAQLVRDCFGGIDRIVRRFPVIVATAKTDRSRRPLLLLLEGFRDFDDIVQLRVIIDFRIWFLFRFARMPPERRCARAELRGGFGEHRLE